jgi:hypothetical protein
MTEPMLLDRLLPAYDATRVDHRVIAGDLASVYEGTRRADFMRAWRQSLAVRTLFSVRGAVARRRRSRSSSGCACRTCPRTGTGCCSASSSVWSCVRSCASSPTRLPGRGRLAPVSARSETSRLVTRETTLEWPPRLPVARIPWTTLLMAIMHLPKRRRIRCDYQSVRQTPISASRLARGRRRRDRRRRPSADFGCTERATRPTA